MSNIITLKISHKSTRDSSENKDSKFWQPFIAKKQERTKAYDKDAAAPTVSSFEDALIKNFGNQLSQSLVEYCGKSIRQLENYGLFKRYEDKNGNDRGLLYNDAVAHVTAFERLTTKLIYASEVHFRVKKIEYGSISLDLVINPIDKFIQIFDENIELMQFFFESYVPDAFQSTAEVWSSNDIPLECTAKIPSDIFGQKTITQKILPGMQTATVDNVATGKIDKTKFITGIFTSPMLFPFIVALAVLYCAYLHLQFVQNEFVQQHSVLSKERQQLVKEYQELIRLYKDSAKKN